jgi:hypothetical protein
MHKYLPKYEEAFSHLWLCKCSILNFLKFEENLILFSISVIRPQNVLNVYFTTLHYHFYILRMNCVHSLWAVSETSILFNENHGGHFSLQSQKEKKCLKRSFGTPRPSEVLHKILNWIILAWHYLFIILNFTKTTKKNPRTNFFISFIILN